MAFLHDHLGGVGWVFPFIYSLSSIGVMLLHGPASQRLLFCLYLFLPLVCSITMGIALCRIHCPLSNRDQVTLQWSHWTISFLSAFESENGIYGVEFHGALYPISLWRSSHLYRLT